MLYPKPQQRQSLNIKDYTNRIIVAGTRGYNDRLFFHNSIIEYLDNFTEPVIFISGAAANGADRLIIEWSNKFNYPCKQYPANWSNGKGAGYRRNEEMALIGTHLLAYYDGASPGTSHMLNISNMNNIRTKVFLI